MNCYTKTMLKDNLHELPYKDYIKTHLNVLLDDVSQQDLFQHAGVAQQPAQRLWRQLLKRLIGRCKQRKRPTAAQRFREARFGQRRR